MTKSISANGDEISEYLAETSEAPYDEVGPPKMPAGQILNRNVLLRRKVEKSKFSVTSS